MTKEEKKLKQHMAKFTGKRFKKNGEWTDEYKAHRRKFTLPFVVSGKQNKDATKSKRKKK